MNHFKHLWFNLYIPTRYLLHTQHPTNNSEPDMPILKMNVAIQPRLIFHMTFKVRRGGSYTLAISSSRENHPDNATVTNSTMEMGRSHRRNHQISSTSCPNVRLVEKNMLSQLTFQFPVRKVRVGRLF